MNYTSKFHFHPSAPACCRSIPQTILGGLQYQRTSLTSFLHADARLWFRLIEKTWNRTFAIRWTHLRHQNLITGWSTNFMLRVSKVNKSHCFIKDINN